MGFYVVPHAQRKGEGSSDRVISATGKAGRQAGVGRIEARLSRATSNMHATNIVSMRIPICVQKSGCSLRGKPARHDCGLRKADDAGGSKTANRMSRTVTLQVAATSGVVTISPLWPHAVEHTGYYPAYS